MNVVNETPYAFAPFMGKVVYPKDTLTLIVKGTFEFLPGQPVRAMPAGEQLPPTGDLYYDDDPHTSLRYDSDFAHFKPRADVCVVGHCHVPGGEARPACSVSFRAGHIEKSLMVFGNRHWQRSRMGTRSMSEPEPFTSMELRYENSFGGPDYSHNPVGKGIRSKTKGVESTKDELPNIKVLSGEQLHTLRDGAPAGFGPLGRTWSQRMALVGSYGKKWKNERWPWLPEDFNWGCFNAAPADQQVKGYLRGDEALYFENMHPEHSAFHVSLPGKRLRCFIFEQKDDQHLFREVKTNLDTLWVDMDGPSLVLVWRGLATVASKACDQVEDVFIVQEDVQGTPLPLEYYEQALNQRKAEAAGVVVPAEEESAEAKSGVDGADGTQAVKEKKTPAMEAFLQQAMEQGPAILKDAGMDPKLLNKLKSVTDPERYLDLLVQGLDVDPQAVQKIHTLNRSQFKEILDQHRPETEKLLMEQGHDASMLKNVENLLTGKREPVDPPANDPQALAAAALAGEDMSDKNLSGVDFHGLELDGANFGGAQLPGAIFTNASLRGANFSEASLERANFEGADMSQANLSGADLSDACLAHANLSDADLSGSVMINARMVAVNMQQADLSGAQLGHADISGGRLGATLLKQADLSNADMTEADFTMAVMDLAVLDGANLTQARFARAKAARASFYGSLLLETDFTEAELEEGNFMACRCDHANFGNANLTGATFEGVVGHHVNFREACLDKMRAGENARLPGSIFRRAYGEKGNWAGADLQGADFILSKMPYCDFNQANLAGCDCRTADMKGAVFDKARLNKAQFNRANLFQARMEEAVLAGVNFKGANLYGSEFLNASIDKRTNFDGADLKGTKLSDILT